MSCHRHVVIIGERLSADCEVPGQNGTAQFLQGDNASFERLLEDLSLSIIPVIVQVLHGVLLEYVFHAVFHHLL